MFSDRPGVRLAFAFAFALAAGCGGGPAAPNRYDRVVLVTIDTLRADHLSSYGYRRETSPFIDELAGEGVLFENATATVSHTAPSHASMFTGLLPLEHGVQRNGDTLDPALPTVAGHFDRAGYRTGAFVGTGFLRRTANGFRTIDDLLRKGGDTVDAALSWLSDGDPARPFFLWVHLFDVHEAEVGGKAAPRQDYDELRRRSPFSVREFYDYVAELHGLPNPPLDDEFPGIEWEAQEGLRESFLPTRKDIARRIEDYDAQIVYVDRQIERLYDGVAALESSSPCLWIVTSDHGEGLGSHGYRGHDGHIYQAQLHVPLVVHASDGSLASRRVRTRVSLLDLYPTLAEVPAGSVPASSDGRSLWPQLTGEGALADDRIVYAQKKRLLVLKNQIYTAFDGDEKYILNTAREDEYYDLAQDPGERRNRIDSPRAERLRARLRAKLEALDWEAERGEPEELPPEMARELEALGYTGD